MCGSKNIYDRYRIMFLKGKPRPTESLELSNENLSIAPKTFEIRVSGRIKFKIQSRSYFQKISEQTIFDLLI